MAALRNLLAAGLGTAVVVVSFAMVVVNSPLVGAAMDLNAVFNWSVAFVAGIIVAGWGLSRAVSGA